VRAWIRKSLSLLGLSMVLGLAGCLELPASLHPLFAAGDAERVPGIEGYWVDDNHGDGGLQIKASDGGAYEVVIVDTDKPTTDSFRLEARFGSLGDELFWDLSRKDVTPGSDIGVWPVHLPARVRLEGRSLEIAFLDPKALGEALASGEIVLAHTVVDDDLMLVAPSDELQAFLRDNGWRDELFSEPLRYVRGRQPR
jgi:hypothetical protein